MPRRPALERRHRHLREGEPRDARARSATARTTPCASTRASCARASSPRAATSASPRRRASRPRCAGVRLDSDAIDNSGGVDLSDHEVNYKILLAPLLRSGAAHARRERHAALFGAVGDACESVLAHNRAPGALRSRSTSGARASDPQAFLWAAEFAVREPPATTRASSSCRTPRRSPARRSAGRGFMRPELAVLLGLAKLHARGALGGDALLDRPLFAPLLDGVLPGAPSAKRWPEALAAPPAAPRDHRARRARTGWSTPAASR